MQISQELPQFTNKRALLIVTGKQEASFYLAENGTIKKLERFYIPRPTYSDNEGYVEKRMFGVTMGGGFTKEFNKQAHIEKFLKELEEKTKEIFGETKASEIYLFSPGYILRAAKGAVQSQPSFEIKGTYKGDYHHEHPFKLLKKIAKGNKREPVPIMREAARKILDKAKQAQKIIGRRGKK